MAQPWTGALIAPNQRIHDATSTAISSTGGTIAHTLRQGVLRDPTLGSRTTGPGAYVPPGTPVGSASLASQGAGGIPATIQAAMQNLQGNIQSSSLAQILNQVLHGIGNGSNAPSPAQERLFTSQANALDQQVAQQAAPGNIQRQIEALTYDQGASPYVWSGWNPNPHGTSGMTNYPHKVFPNVPTSPMGGAGPLGYEGSAQQQRNNQLVTLQGNQNFAKQAASGWVNPITY